MVGARTSLIASLALALAAAVSFGCAPPRQCNAQNDCPMNQGCTADGRCVAVDADVARADAQGSDVLSVSSSSSDVPVDNGSVPGTMSGVLGPLTLTNAPLVTTPVPGYFATTAHGQGADALVILFTSQHLDLTTPGTHHYDANDMNAPVSGQACTTNESPSVQHFDEPTSVDVTVKAGGAVDIAFNGPGADVTASFAQAPPQ
jgi:hypothetical protein